MPATQDGASSFLVGLAKYEGGEGEDNYRHRMIVNVAGLLVTVALSIAGAWLVIQIADLRKNQDCVLSGRRNCTPIDASLLRRRGAEDEHCPPRSRQLSLTRTRVA